MNKKILALAIPNIISSIAIPLVGLVDIAIVGRLGGSSYIGAIAIGTTIFNFVYWNFAFIRMGTSGLTAQAYGSRDLREIAAIFVRGLFVALLIAVGLLIFQQPVGQASLWMMNGSDETSALAAEYFYARIWAAPATVSLFAFHGWFIGMQNSRFPMYMSIIVNVINVILGIWFTFYLNMGIKGVAWGTVCAQYGGLLSGIFLWLRYYGRFRNYIDVRQALKFQPMMRFFAVNRDIFLRTACIVAVYTFFTAASSGMGDTTLAINTLLIQLFTLFSYSMDGFAYAGESLVGRYVGAQNRAMTYKCIKYLMFWSGAMSLIYVSIYAIWWDKILMAFTSSPEIIEGARGYVLWVMALPLVAFAPFLIDGVLIGATQTRILRNSVFIATAIFFGTYYGLVGTQGNNALWLAFLVFLIMRGVLQYIMTSRLRNILGPAPR